MANVCYIRRYHYRLYHTTYADWCRIDHRFTLTVLVGVIDTKTAVQGFGNPSIWLIAMAFFISRGFVKTGLGRRIALQFVRLFGKKTLGLAYSLVGVDLILAPATPSNTARAGGIMFPIIQSFSKSFDSDETRHRA